MTHTTCKGSPCEEPLVDEGTRVLGCLTLRCWTCGAIAVAWDDDSQTARVTGHGPPHDGVVA